MEFAFRMGNALVRCCASASIHMKSGSRMNERTVSPTPSDLQSLSNRLMASSISVPVMRPVLLVVIILPPWHGLSASSLAAYMALCPMSRCDAAFFEACGRRMASSAFRKMISVPQLLQSLRFGLVECLWITVGMTSSSDLEQIESRIVSLVKDFAFLHADDSVASSCRPIATWSPSRRSRQVRVASGFAPC